MIKNKTLLTLLGLMLMLPVSAQKDIFNPVYTGVTSLSIAPDARAGAMGDVGCATDPDVNSQYWNPAKYPFNIARAGVSLSYTPWLRQLVKDIDLAYVTGFYRIGDYSAISSSLTYFSLGEVIADEYTADWFAMTPLWWINIKRTGRNLSAFLYSLMLMAICTVSS